MLIIQSVFKRIDFLIYYLLILISEKLLMQTKNDTEMAHINGPNFKGNVELTANALNIQLTDFKKGVIYVNETSNMTIEKDFKRYLIFKKIDDLFDEIVTNQHLQISDQNTLIIPIQVIYKGRVFDLKIELPLAIRKFNNQAEKIQNLFDQLQKLNKQKMNIQNQLPKIIHFKADYMRENYKMFEVSGRKIKKIGTNQHNIFNHSEILPKNGIFYFKIKIIKSTQHFIFVGICGKQIVCATNDNAFYSPYFMGFYLHNGFLYGNSKNPKVGSNFTIINGQSIVKVEIDMNKKWISWYLNANLLYSTEITKQIANIDFYPMFTLQTEGDTVEFLNK